MNTLLLLIATRPWRARSSRSLVTRVFVAVSLFSIEMQLVTLTGAGSIETLPIVNAVLAVAAFPMWALARRRLPLLDGRDPDAESPAASGGARPAAGAGRPAVPAAGGVPLIPALLLAGLVLVLNVGRPLEAADPYHFDKMAQVERSGTLEYDRGAETKINILNALYETVLVDLRLIPAAGPWLVRLHGLLGLGLYLLAVGAVRELLGARPGWVWSVMLAVPVLFHQLVLVKNDLFVGVPALVVLAWLVARLPAASWQEIVWASWLAGLAVAVKLTSLPLLVIVTAGVLLRHRSAQAIPALAVGTVAGLAAGGLIFSLAANVQMYGDIMPSEEISNRPSGVVDAAVNVGRFTISLFDLGVVTRAWWPGRGGWGGTFGLGLVWALAALAWSSRHVPEARRALAVAGVWFLAFAVAFPDADVAHRLALAPGVLLLAVALHVVSEGGGARERLRMALVPVALLSSAQIVRSAALYLMRP